MIHGHDSAPQSMVIEIVDYDDDDDDDDDDF